ncbi:YadA-like family protein [Avibacterium paragallinarum]|uniref:YadA-like family protein n=1 Tax=Avibacterium paragallinarum TaxID=728 RepID=UPI00397D793B
MVGINNIAIGEESVATGTNSQALGYNAVATGGNISKEEFHLLLNEYNQLVNDIKSTETSINDNALRLQENKREQTILLNYLNLYQNAITRADQKLAQRNQLTQQKQQKEQDLSTANNQLTALQNRFNSTVFTGKTKIEYKNFVNTLNLLDWNKLKDSNADRRDELANDLKGIIEKDFANLQYTTADYRKIIDGYINAQGGYAANSAAIENKLKRSSYDFHNANDGWYHASGVNTSTSLESLVIDQNYRVNTESIKQSIDTYFVARTSPNYKDLTFYNTQDSVKYTAGALLKHILSPTNISDHLGNNSFLLNTVNSYGYYYDSNYFRLYRPPLTSKANFQSSNQIYYANFEYYDYALRSLESEVNLRDSTVSELKRVNLLFNQYYEKIDWNTEKWLFDKEEFRVTLDKHKAFNDLVGNYLNNLAKLGNTSLADDERDKINAELVAQRKLIIEKAKDKSNFVHYFKPTKLTDTAQAEFDKLIKNWQEIENEVDQGLRVYDPKNEVIQAVISEVDKQAKEISNKQSEINNLSNTIANLTRQIQSIQLTAEEQNAAQLKAETEQQIAQKQAEKTRLEQELTEKRNALLGLQQQLDNTPVNQGENALAQGTDAFASGKNSIAFGTESTASAENAVAMGNKSVASGKNAIAIGNEAQALKESAIAIGNKAIVNGESAVGIGDQIGVSGNKAVGIGANSTITGDNAVSIGAENIVVHKNAVAIGANITQTAENSVNLGNASAATTQRTEQTAGTTDYNSAEILGSIYTFAAGENIQGVVTVGDKGKERRIQNVAAGLISPKSTDAVNGSQLYQMAKAVDDGRLGLVKQDPNTQLISVAGQRGGNLVSFYNNQGEVRRLTGIAEGIAQTDAINKAQFDREVGRLDGRVNQVERDVKKIKGSVSTAVAMANMPTATRPGQSYLSAGTGYSNGTTAISVGLSHLSDNGRITYKFSGGASQRGNVAFGAGIGFAW